MDKNKDIEQNIMKSEGNFNKKGVGIKSHNSRSQYDDSIYEKKISKEFSTNQVNFKDFEDILNEVAGLKGKAITTLATWLYKHPKGFASSRVQAVKIATSIIKDESNEFYEVLITIINDGFTGDIHEAISIARNV